jgi:hypothetical protein
MDIDFSPLEPAPLFLNSKRAQNSKTGVHLPPSVFACPLLRRVLHVPDQSRARAAWISSGPIIEVDFILIDQGLTLPKTEALHQRSARVEHRRPVDSAPISRCIRRSRCSLRSWLRRRCSRSCRCGERNLIREGAIRLLSISWNPGRPVSRRSPSGVIETHFSLPAPPWPI